MPILQKVFIILNNDRYALSLFFFFFGGGGGGGGGNELQDEAQRLVDFLALVLRD